MDELQSLDLLLVLKVAVLAISGLIVGFVGNMLGGGGGRPRLLLVYWAADSPLNAAGTNLLVGVLGGMIGTWMHLREGRIDLRLLLFMGIPSVIGAFIGGFFAGLAPRVLLLLVVGIITTWYGYLLLTGKRGTGVSEGSANPAPEIGPSIAAKPVLLRPSVRRHLLEMGFGLAIGLFGGAVGLQGGQLRLTAVTGLLNTDVRMAVGTTSHRNLNRSLRLPRTLAPLGNRQDGFNCYGAHGHAGRLPGGQADRESTVAYLEKVGGCGNDNYLPTNLLARLYPAIR